MKKILTAILLIFLTVVGCGKKENTQVSGDSKFKGQELNVYVSFHDNMIKALADEFNKETGAKISYIRLPTGQAVARIKSEKDNPQASVWIGGTADAQQNVADQGLLVTFNVPNLKYIPKEFKSKDNLWAGIYLEALSIGYNSERFDKEFKDKVSNPPTTLDDLLNPAYKGEIIMPNPKTSGTGLTIIASILAEKGDKEGWAYINKLFKNVAQFTSSGFTPAEKVGTGEYLIALNFVSDQIIVRDRKFPIVSTVYKNAGWNIVPVAKIKGGKNPELADAFINFALSKKAGDILVKIAKGISVRSDVIAPAGGKKLSELPINRNFDPVSAAANKEKILKELNLDK